MTDRNDAWMKLWDSVPAEHQWIFEQTNEHYNAAFGSMLGAVLKALSNIEENQAGFAHPLGALVAKQDLITEHLVRQDTALSGLKEGQAVLRGDFQAAGENLNQWQAEIEATLADFRQSRAESIKEREELRAGLEASKADRKALHADLEESKTDRKAIRQEQQAHDAAIREKLNELAAAIEELKLGVNGRLSELIKESKAASRAQGQAEGHDEERADPGSG